METLKGLLFAIAVIIIYYAFSRLIGRKKRYLLKNGNRTVAKVVNIEKTGANVSSSGQLDRPILEIDLEIEDFERPQTLVTIRHVFDIGAVLPEPGDRIYLLIDPKNPDNVMVSPD